MPPPPDHPQPPPDRWYRAVFDAHEEGLCLLQVLFDASGGAVDYRFVDANPAFERQTGLHGARGRTARELVPDLDPFWFEMYGKVASTGEPARFRQSAPAMSRTFDVHATRVGEPHEHLVALVFNDVTERERAEAEVREGRERLVESERRFREFADTAPAMLWVTEPDGRCSYLSRGWFDYTGQPESEALGFGWLEVVHPDDREEAGRLFVEANARRAPFSLEHRLRTRSGEYRWVIDAGRPRTGANGEFLGYIGSVIDIHARRMAEESARVSRSRLDLIVSSGQVGLWYCDLPFETLDWNPTVKRHFGLPADAVVTIDTFFEQLHPDDRERTRAAIAHSIATRTPYDIEYRTVGRDGVVRWIRAIGQSDYDGDEPKRFDGITIDVSERVRHEEALREADRRKDEFLAILAHELRNPLAPIANGLRIMDAAGNRPEALAQVRIVMDRQVRHLVRLIDDLMDVSRISRGKLELRRAPVRLGEIVQHAVDLARPALDKSQNAFALSNTCGDIELHADATRIAQALSNLLHNAAKFTGPGGRIELVVRCTAAEAEIRVRDNGIGIPADMLARVFELFTQVDRSVERQHGGLGIGLSLSQSLVRLHGGEITVSSEGVGQGAEFVMRLPRVPVLAESPADGSPRPVQAHCRVLVVDDNTDAADSLAAMLSLAGHEVHAAYRGSEAIEIAERVRPGLVFVDLGMPQMNGFEVARRLRARLDGTPVLVALTGWGQADDRRRSLEAGFDLHFVKPLQDADLRAALAAAAR